MAKLVDASDLKSADASHPGSSPGGRTNQFTFFSFNGFFAVPSASTIARMRCIGVEKSPAASRSA